MMFGRLKSILLLACLLAPTTFANAGTATFGGLDTLFTVQVNDQICASGALQCSQLGEPGNEAPATGNRAPVQVAAMLLNLDLDPLLGLVEEDFTINSAIVSPGSSSLEIVSCDDCFNARSTGVYSFFIQPTGTWKSGTYIVRVSADVGPKTLHTLARIDVP